MKVSCSLLVLLCVGTVSVAHAQPPTDLTPQIKIEAGSPTNVVLSWPYPAVGFRLESATELSGSDSWSLVTSAPAFDSDRYWVSVELTGDRRFFRLRSIYPDGLPPNPTGVAPPLDPSEFADVGSATAFLYNGSEPVQTGVADGAIEPRRAGVLRGRVITRDGQALGGVQITVLDHPEFGGTLSRQDGRFDFAVNGGGRLVVDYQKPGFLPAQRQVQVRWQDYAEVPEVALIPLDSKVTTVILGSNAPMQAARSSLSSDGDGQRQATLLFSAGTEGRILKPDGSTQPLSQLSIRATEFTTGPNGPSAMPAELPAGVGYTYAVSLTADEALAGGVKVAGKDVVFSKPVVLYVENFLSFPVGGIVPLGYYDDDRAAWVPYDNGRIVKILGIAGGKADLDADGDSAADDAAALLALGITDDERARLAALYPVGQGLWRMAISHFSTWDANWLWGPAPDAADAGIAKWLLDAVQQPWCLVGLCDLGGNSVIQAQNQTLTESFPVAGTPFSLVYASDRTPGRLTGYSLNIPLSLETLHPEVKRIDLEILVAGRLFRNSFPPLTNQTYRYTWDRRDAYGRQPVGAQRAKVRVGYVYTGYYYQSRSDLIQAFGYKGNGVPITANRARQEFIMWQEWDAYLGPWDARGAGLGGWTLNAHHTYDPAAQILYLGNGTQRRQTSSVASIRRAAGTGANAGLSMGGYNGDDRLGVDALLSQPRGVAIAPDGDLYIADTWNHRVRRVDSEGVIRPVAGGGRPADGLGDGGLATSARLRSPFDVAIGPDGSVYIAERDGARIRRVTTAGMITTVAGGGSPVDGLGDGSLATDARLNEPNAIALGPDGSLYIADTASHRVRQVGPDGRIHTVAGTGMAGFNGDDLIADQTQLKYPTGVALGYDGSVYIADSQNSRIRRVRPDGVCETIAGAGTLWPADGVVARQVSMDWPTRVAVGPEGVVYFSGAKWGDRIYRIGPDGLLTTVAGPPALGIFPSPAYSGDGGAAVGARMNHPHAIALSPEGTLFVADCFNHVIRQVSLPLPGYEGRGLEIPSEDGALLYEFDHNGRHRRTVNAFTGATVYTFTCDARGLLIAVEDGDSNLTTIERALDGTPTAILAPFGHRTTLDLGTDGYLCRIADPLNHGFDLAYTTEGLLASAQDSRGRISRFAYDTLGRLIKDENAGCCFSELSHTEANGTYTVALTSGEGLQTLYTVGFLPTGEQTRLNAFPDGTTHFVLLGTDSSEQATYGDGTVSTTCQGGDPRFGMQSPFTKSLSVATPRGRAYTQTAEVTASLTNVLNPFSLQSLTNQIVVNGRTNLIVYDAPARTTTFTSAEGRRSTNRVDHQGRLLELDVAGIEPTLLRYDVHGRLESLSQGERQVRFGFDARTGWLQSTTNSENQVTAYERDAAGRTTRLTRADKSAWAFGYDEADHLLTLIEPNGASQHTFTYTGHDLIESYRSPLGAEERFAYDRDRRLTKREFPSGQALEWKHNSKGQLTSFQTPEGSHVFSYDSETGLLREAVSRDGQRVAYDYDGRMLTKATWSGVVTGTVHYAYNNDLRVAQMSYAGLTLTNAYDKDGLLTQSGTITLDRDPRNGRVTAIRDGAFQILYTYTAYGQVATVTAGQGITLYDVAYDYDKLGRIRQKIETIEGTTATWEYAYDALGQLIAVKRDGAMAESYAYDAAGNRMTMTNLLAGESVPLGGYTYDLDNKLVSAGTRTCAYDSDGRLHSVAEGNATTTYAYNTDGTLARVHLAGNRQVHYLYDARGRRILRAIDGVETGRWLYGQGTLPLAEYDAAGNLRSVFVYAGSPSPIQVLRNGILHHIVSDHLGSPRLIVDGAGVVTKHIEYDAFGNVVRVSAADPSSVSPHGFAGGLTDPDHALLRFGVRDYQASIGRWTGKDPLLLQGGRHLYTYVSNDPVNRRDPSGLDDNTAASCTTASASASPVTLENILQGVAVDGEYVDLLRAVASRDLEMKGTKDPTTPDALERSRSRENEADAAATIYLHQTSYHSKALEGYLITLNFVEMKTHKVPSPFDVHPPTFERIQRIEALSNALQRNMPQDHRLLNKLQFQELISDLEAFR